MEEKGAAAGFDRLKDASLEARHPVRAVHRIEAMLRAWFLIHVVEANSEGSEALTVSTSSNVRQGCGSNGEPRLDVDVGPPEEQVLCRVS